MQTRSMTSLGRTCQISRAGACTVVCGLRFFGKLPFQRPTRLPQGEVGRSRRAPLSLLPQRAVSATPSLLDNGQAIGAGKPIKYHGVHHVALLVQDLERSLEFYQGILGLEVNPDRPHSKLPYRGAWLWIGPEMIHLMELDNPDPLTGRPQHGGRDRHFCIGVTDVKPLVEKLQAAGVEYTMSMSGRAAVFFRDPDMNCLEVVEQEPWR